jgi:hypothetical protein
VVLTTDYSRFDLSRLGQAATPLFRDPAGWLAFRLPEIQMAVQQQLPALQLLPLFLLIVLFSLRHWRSRRFYGAVISLIIVAMLASPLLQGQYAQAYNGRVAADRQMRQARQAETEQQQEVQTGVQELNSSWDPHQSPLSAGQNQAAFEAEAKNGQLSTLQPTGLPNMTSLLAAGDDSDNDGLTDELEAYWGTCAYLVGSPEYLASADCDDVPDPTDSDGDGLSDDAEVNYLNTFPTSVDTDGDAITDTLEVEGFIYNGRTWYLNPNEEDTNNDGLPDNLECDLFNPGPLDLAVACGDTDSNGIPDLFDNDNDGDPSTSP